MNMELRINHPLDPRFIGGMNQGFLAQMTLSFRRFLGQNVAGKRFLALDPPRASQRKSLLGATIGFHFRHNLGRLGLKKEAV